MTTPTLPAKWRARLAWAKAAAAYARKAVISLSTVAGSLIAFGLVPEPEKGWITTAVVAAGAMLHFAVPNGVKPKVRQ